MACLVASPAWAARCADFDVIGNGARTAYNPFEPVGASEPFDIRIDSIADGVKGIRFQLVAVDDTQAARRIGAAGPASYNIVWTEDDSRQALAIGASTLGSMDGAQVQPQGRQGQAVTRFRLEIPRGQAAAAGVHSEYVNIEYQCLDNRGNPLGPIQQGGSVLLRVTVPHYAAAYIGSPGQTRGSIDFGTISADTASLTRGISVTALSTSPYEVHFESENGGFLRRRKNDPQGIDYQMTYAGLAVPNGTRALCPTTSVPQGSIEDFRVTLNRDSVGRLPAGAYSDVVTLTFQPRDVISPSGCQIRGR
jgi:spore coat protein U-like protein